MRILIKRGRRLHGPGDRTYLNSSTEIIELTKTFPAPKCVRKGCAHIEEQCTRYKMEVARVPFKKTIYPCDVVNCNEDVLVVPAERLNYTKGKSCKAC